MTATGRIHVACYHDIETGDRKLLIGPHVITPCPLPNCIECGNEIAKVIHDINLITQPTFMRTLLVKRIFIVSSYILNVVLLSILAGFGLEILFHK